MSSKQKDRGRPQGSTNVEVTQIVDVSRCPECGKTDRSRYHFVSCIEHGGVTSAGREYTHTVKRRTECLNCNRRRIDTFHENRVPDANPGEENEPE